MSIDFDAIRKKLNQLSGTNSRRNVMWRPQEGEEATIRLLPFKDNDGQPFKELWFYYNIGNNPGLLAPYQFSQADPIQELINKLRDEGTKESYELAKKLYPKMRCYAPVVVRGEEDRGVRLWSFGKTVYQTLLNIMLDEDYGDITDPVEGRDVKVVCTKPPGRMWATTDVRPRGKQSQLSDNSQTLKSWTSGIPELDDLYTCKTYEELEKIVNDWLNGNDEESTGVEFQTSTTRAVPDSTEPAADVSEKSQAKYSSLDEAFADLDDL
jgi:hypothetical protein